MRRILILTQTVYHTWPSMTFSDHLRPAPLLRPSMTFYDLLRPSMTYYDLLWPSLALSSCWTAKSSLLSAGQHQPWHPAQHSWGSTGYAVQSRSCSRQSQMGDHVVKHAKIFTHTGSTRVVEPMEQPLYGMLSRPYRLWLTPGTVLLCGSWLRRLWWVTHHQQVAEARDIQSCLWTPRTMLLVTPPQWLVWELCISGNMA